MPNVSSETNIHTFKQTVIMTEEEIKNYERKKAKAFKQKINKILYSGIKNEHDNK